MSAPGQHYPDALHWREAPFCCSQTQNNKQKQQTKRKRNQKSPPAPRPAPMCPNVISVDSEEFVLIASSTYWLAVNPTVGASFWSSEFNSSRMGNTFKRAHLNVPKSEAFCQEKGRTHKGPGNPQWVYH